MSEPATPIAVSGPAGELRGDGDGEGPALLLLHGLTATRRYVVHGSRTLARRGYRTIAYDARGSWGDRESAPAPTWVTDGVSSGEGWPLYLNRYADLLGRIQG